MSCRMLIADLDGTVLNSCDEVTPETIAALKRLDDAGCRVVLATGRSYRTALPVVRRVGLGRPVICTNGAVVKDPASHGTLDSMPFDPPVARRVTELLVERGESVLLCVDGQTDCQEFLHIPGSDPSPEMLKFLEHYSHFCRTTSLDEIDDTPVDCLEVAAIGSAARLERCGQAVRDQLDSQIHTLIIYAPNLDVRLFEAFAPGVNKWTAAVRLATAEDIALEEIAAVGDDVNDVEMVRRAGLGIAMGNAADCVREAADRIAPTNDQNGLVEVVDWLLQK